MQTEQALSWLMQNSDPVTRYRMLTELLKEKDEKNSKESRKLTIQTANDKEGRRYYYP